MLASSFDFRPDDALANPSDDSQPWRRVHHAFLEAMGALAADPRQLTEALASASLDDVVNAVLRQLCEREGVDPAEYVNVLQTRPAVRRELDGAVNALLEHPALAAGRRTAALAELRQQLYLLDYATTGTEPPPAIFDAIPLDERARMRGAATDLLEVEPELPQRLRHALSKQAATFGVCEVCSQAIPIQRLQLVPYAERCTACQLKHEGPPPPREGPPPVAVTYFARK